MLRRLFDICFAIIGLIVLFPLIIAIYIIGFFDTGSPLFFQERLGKHQKRFKLIKFRSMKVNTPQVGTHLASRDSITKTGYFLRKSKLDELPQLFNVLIGDMSLVGPRPGLPTQKELLEHRERRGIFGVRPGITGLAQINNIDMSTPNKLSRYDQLMIKRLDTKLYFKIILLTLTGKGSGDVIK